MRPLLILCTLLGAACQLRTVRRPEAPALRTDRRDVDVPRRRTAFEEAPKVRRGPNSGWLCHAAIASVRATPAEDGYEWRELVIDFSNTTRSSTSVGAPTLWTRTPDGGFMVKAFDLITLKPGQVVQLRATLHARVGMKTYAGYQCGFAD